MRSIGTLLAILIIATCGFAALIARRQNDTTLQDWQLIRLTTFSPSGRPGSYPWRDINATVTDPNEIILGTGNDGSEVVKPAGNQGLNCFATWISPDTAYGRRWPCQGTGDGYWFMEIVEVPSGSATTNFDAKFTRVVETIDQGSGFRKTFSGQAHFEVGQNMAGSCGGSGVCSWGLKAENSPLPIEQEELEQQTFLVY